MEPIQTDQSIILELIANPNKIHPTHHLILTKGMIEKYPYFSGGHFIMANILQGQGNPEAEKYIQKASGYAFDRESLFNFVNPKELIHAKQPSCDLQENISLDESDDNNSEMQEIIHLDLEGPKGYFSYLNQDHENKDFIEDEIKSSFNPDSILFKEVENIKKEDNQSIGTEFEWPSFESEEKKIETISPNEEIESPNNENVSEHSVHGEKIEIEGEEVFSWPKFDNVIDHSSEEDENLNKVEETIPMNQWDSLDSNNSEKEEEVEKIDSALPKSEFVWPSFNQDNLPDKDISIIKPVPIWTSQEIDIQKNEESTLNIFPQENYDWVDNEPIIYDDSRDIEPEVVLTTIEEELLVKNENIHWMSDEEFKIFNSLKEKVKKGEIDERNENFQLYMDLEKDIASGRLMIPENILANLDSDEKVLEEENIHDAIAIYENDLPPIGNEAITLNQDFLTDYHLGELEINHDGENYFPSYTEEENIYFAELDDYANSIISEPVPEKDEKTKDTEIETIIIGEDFSKGVYSFTKWLSKMNGKLLPEATVSNQNQATDKFDNEASPEMKEAYLMDQNQEKEVVIRGNKSDVDAIIDKFIKNEPKISRLTVKNKFYNPEEYAQKSAEEDLELATETLAKIYNAQGLTKKAIDIYEKLGLMFPEKSSYFVGLIENIKKQL